MTIHHHPDPSTLMSYAAGSLEEPLSAVVACHAALCAACRREIGWIEGIGSALVDTMPAGKDAVAVPPLPAAEKPSAPTPRAIAAGDVPAPLVGLIGTDLDAIAWKRLALGIWHRPLPLSHGTAGDLRLIKVAPGLELPEHGHAGQEMTLLLRGAYVDEVGRFATGDVADLDENVEHRPVADAGMGCICLIASVMPARYKGWLPRLLQPFIGI